MKKKILVVGSNGYIGSRLVQLMGDDYIVTGIDKNYFKNCTIGKSEKILFVEKCASKLNKQDLKGVDALVFLAAFNNDPILQISTKAIYDKELKYTLKAAKLCKKYKIRFIYPSSCSIYGFGKKVFNENSKLNPLTLYSKNKINIEKKLNLLKNKNFKPIILRLGTVFGPSPRLRLDLVANMFAGMAICNKKIELNSNGLSWRPHIFIDDVCKNILFFINCDLDILVNNIYNIGIDKNNIKTIKLANLFKKKFKKLTIKKLNLNNELFKDKKVINGIDKRSYIVSFSRIKKIMKDNYSFISINKGLDILINFLKKNNFNIKMLNSKKYYRLQWYEHLMKSKGVKIC
jgi:nucleoside-diphosphate-sugar epimerase